MTLSIIKPLQARKAEIERQLSETRSAAIVAERAITLCEQLATDIPKKIAAVRATVVFPHISHLSAPEDSLTAREELTRGRQAVAALEALRMDLPEILAHWRKRQRALAG